ncbi:hypothetical protein ILYODFUR_002964 [Ilyodon furcidens]|uniref:Uncharacterized protein n=1 Tax=Ilyodon furcidens TaxID=33524 RepID=A0ABV0UNI0_9TELE
MSGNQACVSWRSCAYLFDVLLTGNQFSSLHSVPGFPCSASLLSEFVGELTLRLSVNLLTAPLAAPLAASLVQAVRTPQQPLPITHLPVHPAALHGLAPLSGRKNNEVIPTSTSHHADVFRLILCQIC